MSFVCWSTHVHRYTSPMSCRSAFSLSVSRACLRADIGPLLIELQVLKRQAAHVAGRETLRQASPKQDDQLADGVCGAFQSSGPCLGWTCLPSATARRVLASATGKRHRANGGWGRSSSTRFCRKAGSDNADFRRRSQPCCLARAWAQTIIRTTPIVGAVRYTGSSRVSSANSRICLSPPWPCKAATGFFSCPDCTPL